MPVSLIGPESAVAAGLRIQILPPSAWPQVAPVWRELAASPGSLFLSEAWVETWIETFSSQLDVSILVFEAPSGPVGACLVVKTNPRRVLFSFRRISLNASGEPPGDTTYLEYNNLLCRTGWEPAVAARLAEYLREQRPDEIALDGFVPGPGYAALTSALARFDLDEVWHPSYYVDLRELRRAATPFEMTLGRATRKHLRQNVRSYSDMGSLQLRAAGDVETALAMFDELADLNRRYWEKRSRYPVFASKRFIAFHRALIARCFPQNAVELLRLSAGQQTVGLVYNLVRDGTVYFYQCGLNYSIDRRLSPGTVVLSQAIQRSLDRGLDTYDFLSGRAPYKKRLATDSRLLVWAVFRKPGLKTNILKLAKAVRNRLPARAEAGAKEKD